jgi:hypothetical protein
VKGKSSTISIFPRNVIENVEKLFLLNSLEEKFFAKIFLGMTFLGINSLVAWYSRKNHSNFWQNFKYVFLFPAQRLPRNFLVKWANLAFFLHSQHNFFLLNCS